MQMNAKAFNYYKHSQRTACLYNTLKTVLKYGVVLNMYSCIFCIALVLVL